MAGGASPPPPPALAAELAVGAGYAVLAAVLLKVFEAESRRRASLDTL